MDAKMGAAQSHMNNFEPLSDVINEKECDTLLLYLPGFMKKHLRVQLTSSGYIRISGSRPLGENKTSSFQKDFPISQNCDKTKITAKFEGGILYVKQPKLAITTPEERGKNILSPSPPPSDTLKPQSSKPNEAEASSSLQAPKKDHEQEMVAHKTGGDKSKKEEEKSLEPKVNEEMESMRDDKRSNDAKTGVITSCDRGKKVTNGVSIGNAAERLKQARIKTNVVMALVLGFALGFYLRNLVWGKN